MNLNNKTILLTGASGGIGQALAHALARKGASLYLVGRNEQAMQRLQQQLPHPERHCIALMKTYSDVEISTLAAQLNESGNLDILINNAGCSHFALLEQQSFDDIREQIRSNIEIPILLTRALLTTVNQPGIVLNIGSILGEIGHPAWSVYSATKAAMHRFSEALHRELRGSGISVLYVAPRSTETALNSETVYALNRKLGNGSDTPTVVATQIVRLLETEQKRYRFGVMERLFVKINAWFPSVVDGALNKKLPVIQAFARRTVRGENK
ncbi:SDR family oxidoreductase [Pectobacterium brasiliense]|uniref:SDR family oxidoreductase n=1 Tax=Pectobacterium brasiliense TaxID=180957 RepID=A0AAE3BEN8_9GAMM|nr:SDR family oxidoreductase [Pectobacterium brasiliense]MBA0215972.1 SDR family oxidoreductase [Pectobacterium brasiliense]MBN3051681.1 SDR family oxidoreductase [Pectobacterium brasiliense]MBN3071440.1 SDR family oxidoreductase [Pectobacterium brasiliense]MBN3171334.1 SDR family oxidoreductase [Pectobacterium brasiliense]